MALRTGSKRRDLRGWTALATMALAALLLRPQAAQAIPSFAEQTGLVCAACHVGFPQLNSFGRNFKLNGYTLGGSTLSWKNFSGMVEAGFTHFNKGVPGGAAPEYAPNDNFSAQQVSVFLGGAIDANLGLGAFVQATYDGVGHHFDWDNTDIRMVHTATIAGKDLVWGLTLNNSPGVTDLWNTLPAWGYPFIDAGLGFGTGDYGPYIGSLAQGVYGGGGYVDWNGWLYAEVNLYASLTRQMDQALNGGEVSGLNIDGAAPYWRLALHHSFGPNSFEVGTFGLAANPYPGPFEGAGTDSVLDVGVDGMYQWISGPHAVTLNAAYVHETANWSASANPDVAAASNGHDRADFFNANLQYLWNQTVGGTLGYFTNSGNQDPLLYANSANGKPNTNGVILEADYYPFNNGGPAIFPWVNAKLFVQDTIYTRFDGAVNNYDGGGRNASDNNTLFAGIWLMF